MDSYLPLLCVGFFVIALVYASVGFGGGSSYLALLAQPMFGIMPEVIRPTALLCNIIVVTGGTILYYRDKKIIWKEVWPFLVASVPLAYIGGFWKLEHTVFFIILGVTLLVAAMFLWIQPNEKENEHYRTTPVSMALGGGIGFLSGLVGIGGGIFLSPMLHFLRWAEPKKIAALASVFILVNSVSGLAGQFSKGIPTFTWSFSLPLCFAVLIGGQLGSRTSLRWFNTTYIKRVTAILILLAGIIILRHHL